MIKLWRGKDLLEMGNKTDDELLRIYEMYEDLLKI